VFFYHRSYDAVVLVLPLVYSTGQARTAQGGARHLFAGCAVAILLVLYLNVDLLEEVFRLSLVRPGWGWLLQATVLPSGTWLVVIAMVCLVTASRMEMLSDLDNGAGTRREKEHA
jgi:hypothetical protein